jgi:hypothetical protein
MHRARKDPGARSEGSKEALLRTIGRWTLLNLIICLAVTYGCRAVDRSDQPQWMQVPVDHVSTVAGKWDGLMRRMPPERRDDWVTVTIAPDGRYEFSSLRTIGVFTGHGVFGLNEGKLVSKSERGTVEAVLYEAGSQRMLRAKGRAADGTEYTAEVKPVK